MQPDDHASGDGNIQVSDLTSGVTAQDLANALVGSGVTVSNVTYSGADGAAGSYTATGTQVGFPSGVVLSSGAAVDIEGPNVSSNTTTGWGTPGNPDLDPLTNGFTTQDAATLSFDFVPTAGTVSFQYVFGSEEYNEYVNSEFNDVFGFFIDGTNCAVLPDGSPVTVNTVNNGVNSGLYIDNTDGHVDTELDGRTVALTCTAAVTPGVTNHAELAIADTSDTALDSDVMLQAGSFSSSNITLTPQTGNANVGTPYTLTATVTKDGSPQAGKSVTITVESGPDAGATKTGTTDNNGQVQFTITGAGVGTDNVSATFTDDAGNIEEDFATIDWTGTLTAACHFKYLVIHTGQRDPLLCTGFRPNGHIRIVEDGHELFRGFARPDGSVKDVFRFHKADAGTHTFTVIGKVPSGPSEGPTAVVTVNSKH
ncbi:MAG: choice-of-anchor L domain-containing protein [Actinomycetes bacterium]